MGWNVVAAVLTNGVPHTGTLFRSLSDVISDFIIATLNLFRYEIRCFIIRRTAKLKVFPLQTK